MVEFTEWVFVALGPSVQGFFVDLNGSYGIITPTKAFRLEYEGKHDFWLSKFDMEINDMLKGIDGYKIYIDIDYVIDWELLS